MKAWSPASQAAKDQIDAALRDLTDDQLTALADKVLHNISLTVLVVSSTYGDSIPKHLQDCLSAMGFLAAVGCLRIQPANADAEVAAEAFMKVRRTWLISRGQGEFADILDLIDQQRTSAEDGGRP